MKDFLPKFDYIKPSTIKEAVRTLSMYKGEAKILAGGTDLLISMREKEIKPKILVDIKGIIELKEITYDRKDGLRIGANVTFNEIIKSDIIKKKFSLLQDAARTVADHEIRNRATLVGNVCNASPAADSVPSLMVLDAKVKAIGPKGYRKIEIHKFFEGVKKTCLSEKELVVTIEIPNPPTEAKGRYLKIQRIRSEDLAVVGASALYAPEEKHGMDVRLSLASVAPTPIRIREVEEIFKSKGANQSIDKLIEECASIVLRKISPISDLRGGKEYRAHLVEYLTKKLLNALLKDGGLK